MEHLGNVLSIQNGWSLGFPIFGKDREIDENPSIGPMGVSIVTGVSKMVGLSWRVP